MEKIINYAYIYRVQFQFISPLQISFQIVLGTIQ